jgi:hypothetical protein
MAVLPEVSLAIFASTIVHLDSHGAQVANVARYYRAFQQFAPEPQPVRKWL